MQDFCIELGRNVDQEKAAAVPNKQVAERLCQVGKINGASAAIC